MSMPHMPGVPIPEEDDKELRQMAAQIADHYDVRGDYDVILMWLTRAWGIGYNFGEKKRTDPPPPSLN
jgi:hypothetical protein